MYKHKQHHKAMHIPTVVHHIVCQHQIEVEVWPSNAELYFQDERFIDPANTQVRFSAIVYNAPTNNVIWDLKNLAGDPGVGSIDPSGLYVSPPKGSLIHGLTEIIEVTAADDPMRKAYAHVTLIGRGPAPEPVANIDLFPKTAYLYYQSGYDNEYIDISNKMQLFKAHIYNSDEDEVEWYVDSGSGYGSDVGDSKPFFLYSGRSTGNNGARVKIKAQLKNNPAIQDEAQVILINYNWPAS